MTPDELQSSDTDHTDADGSSHADVLYGRDGTGAEHAARNDGANDGADGGPKASDTPGTAGDAAGDGAPEAYGDFVLPDGMDANQAAFDKALPVFRDLGLSQEQAQGLVDLQGDLQKMADENAQQVWADQRRQWVEDAKADREIGGDRFEENVAGALRVINRFGTPELKTALAVTGAGDHPEMIRFCAKISKVIGEDDFTTGGHGHRRKMSAAEILYPQHEDQ